MIVSALCALTSSGTHAAPALLTSERGHTFYRFPLATNELQRVRRFSPHKGPWLNASLSADYWYTYGAPSRNTALFLGSAASSSEGELISLGSASAVTLGNADAENNSFVRSAPGVGNSAALKLGAKPRFSHQGIAFSYRQKLTFLGNCALTLMGTLESMTTNLGLATREGTEITSEYLTEYFGGYYMSTSPGHAQARLRRAKLPDHQKTLTGVGDLTATGLGDFSVSLSKELIGLARFATDGFLTLYIPLTQPQTGEYLYAPQLGQNGHAAGEAGLELTGHIWHGKKLTVSVTTGGSLKYALARRESRILTAPRAGAWSQYMLVANEVRGADQPLVPLANLLERGAIYAPGFTASAWGGLACIWENISFRLLWHYERTAAETGRFSRADYVDVRFSIPGPEYDTSIADEEQRDALALTLTRADLSLAESLMPIRERHTLGGRCMWRSNLWKIPCACGIGFSSTLIPAAFDHPTHTLFCAVELSL